MRNPALPLGLKTLFRTKDSSMKSIGMLKTSLHTYFLTIDIHQNWKKTNQLIVKSKGNFQASYVTYDDEEMGSFGNSGVFIPRVFNHILQLLVEVPTSEIDGTNSTLEFSPLLCQLTEEEPSEQICWDSQNKVSSAIQSSLDSDCFTPDAWFWSLSIRLSKHKIPQRWELDLHTFSQKPHTFLLIMTPVTHEWLWFS